MENYIGKDYRRLKKDKFSINKIQNTTEWLNPESGLSKAPHDKERRVTAHFLSQRPDFWVLLVNNSLWVG